MFITNDERERERERRREVHGNINMEDHCEFMLVLTAAKVLKTAIAGSCLACDHHIAVTSHELMSHANLTACVFLKFVITSVK